MASLVMCREISLSNPPNALCPTRLRNLSPICNEDSGIIGVSKITSDLSKVQDVDQELRRREDLVPISARHCAGCPDRD